MTSKNHTHLPLDTIDYIINIDKGQKNRQIRGHFLEAGEYEGRQLIDAHPR